MGWYAPMQVCRQTGRTCFYPKCPKVPLSLTAIPSHFLSRRLRPHSGYCPQAGITFFRWSAEMSLNHGASDDSWRLSLAMNLQ